MNWIILIIAGLFGGIVGGMGMGGGTLLIPLLTLYLGLPQLEAQMINLVAFIPMAVFSLIIHYKNKLVDSKKILYVLPSALIFAVVGAMLSSMINQEILRQIFGWFMIVISSVYLVKLIFNVIIKRINYRNSINLCGKIAQYYVLHKVNI